MKDRLICLNSSTVLDHRVCNCTLIEGEITMAEKKNLS